MIFSTLMFMLCITYSFSDDFCYDESHCDPYAWGDTFQSCHPLLEVHHSPINLDHQMTRDESLEALHLEGFDIIQSGHWILRNDGHSVILEVGSGLSVSGGGLPGIYQTVQLHFHWGSPNTNGSEHTVDQHRYPMEMHVVNMKSIHPNITAALDDPTGLAVLGFFIDVVYADHPHFGHISRRLSSVAYKGLQDHPNISALFKTHLLPESNMTQYYRYHGSLTTPPCSQAVIWTVYEVPIYISWAQLERFASGIYATDEDAEHATPLHNNFRHIHPTFSRVVYSSKDAKLLAATATSICCPTLCKVWFQMWVLTLTLSLSLN